MEELNIQSCSRDEVDALSELLEAHGALALTLTDEADDPILEPELGTEPLWPSVVIKALFEDKDQSTSVLTLIQRQYPHLLSDSHTLAEELWERKCMQDFQAQQFGPRLWVCPSWLNPPDPSAITLKLDPGLAFGTGTHPTTALCLIWLEQADLLGKTLIDFGCGSGILDIAALKLGADKVYALDIDPQALTATRSNAEINDINPKALSLLCAEDPIPQVNLIVANILLKPLEHLKSNFHQALVSNGMLVVSGILKEQTDELIDYYQTEFRLIKAEYLDDWALLVFSKI